MKNTVLILGASGKIGRHASAAFTNAGWTVRHYDRSKNNMAAAAQGASVIVNGLNPPGYRTWSTVIPAITKQVIEAAQSSGATVILPGNVYNFANVEGVFNEHTPHAAKTRKGKIRIAMEQSYASAAKDGVQTIVLRAGSFIDPDGEDDVMGLIHMRSVRKHKLTQIGGVNTRHAYCYLPDWARAAVALAEKKDQLQPFEDIPFPGHDFTVNELKTQLQSMTGKTFKIENFPWLAIRLLSPFWRLAYEMLEMRGQWETSHQLGAEKFQRLLPEFRATDLAEVMACSVPSGLINGASTRLPKSTA